MGSLVVVVVTESIEHALLCHAIRRRRSSRFRLQRAVHALVPAGLLRVTGFDELR